MYKGSTHIGHLPPAFDNSYQPQKVDNSGQNSTERPKNHQIEKSQPSSQLEKGLTS
jgi:hypothetical protein